MHFSRNAHRYKYVFARDLKTVDAAREAFQFPVIRHLGLMYHTARRITTLDNTVKIKCETERIVETMTATTKCCWFLGFVIWPACKRSRSESDGQVNTITIFITDACHNNTIYHNNIKYIVTVVIKIWRTFTPRHVCLGRRKFDLAVNIVIPAPNDPPASHYIRYIIIINY